MTPDAYATAAAERAMQHVAHYWTDDPEYQDAYGDAADEYAACMAHYRAIYDAAPGGHDDRMEAVYAADLGRWDMDLSEAVMVAIDGEGVGVSFIERISIKAGQKLGYDAGHWHGWIFKSAQQGGLFVTGATCPLRTRGPKKGKPNYRKANPATKCTVYLTREEIA